MPWIDGDGECSLYNECYQAGETCSGDVNGLGLAACEPWTYTCGEVCLTDSDCDAPLFATATPVCGVNGICVLECSAGGSCPSGTSCQGALCSNVET